MIVHLKDGTQFTYQAASIRIDHGVQGVTIYDTAIKPPDNEFVGFFAYETLSHILR